MLFAFVARDNSTPVILYKDVSYVTVEQVKDYINGETAAADGFNVVVNYTTGNPVVLPGKGNVDVDNAAKTVSPKSSIQFTTMQGEVAPIIAAPIEYKEVTGASLTADVEKKTYTFTLSFDGGSKVYTDKSTAGATPRFIYEVDGEAIESSEIEDQTAGTEIAIYVDGYSFDNTTWYDFAKTSVGTYKVPEAGAGLTQTGIKAVVTGSGYLGDPITVNLYRTFNNDGVEAITSAEYDGTGDNDKYIIYDEAGKAVTSLSGLTYDGTAKKYTVTDLNNYSWTCPINLEGGKNYLKEFGTTATTNSTVALVELEGDAKWTNDQPITSNILKVTPAYQNADTSKFPVADTYKVSILEDKLPSEGTSCTIHYTVNYTSKGVEKVYTSTITVNNIVSAGN